MTEVGEEHPYEWVEPRRMGVSRVQPRAVPLVRQDRRAQAPPGGGTTLLHRLRLAPRYWWIRRALPWGSDGIGEAREVYRRIDAASPAGWPSGRVDPFVESAAPGACAAATPGARLDRLEAGSGWRRWSIARRLLAHARAGDGPARPLALAHRWGLDADAVVAACLHAAREGLLVLLWDILCPSCRLSWAIEETLRRPRARPLPACDLDFALDFAGSIELVFRVHPEIRAGRPGHLLRRRA